MTNNFTDAQSEREIVITRVFDAPRELVFKAWTDPAHVAQWWGPKGFTTRVTELDLRPGGKWRYVMIGPDGTEYPAKGVFREIVPLERIITSDEFDQGFEKVMNADLPRGIVMTAVFDDDDEHSSLPIEGGSRCRAQDGDARRCVRELRSPRRVPQSNGMNAALHS